ncbi:hypothetical protein C7450_105425 [Chelatococcus asaccharovorans]|uniref:Uncharacterized protein n=1 Tax=Chelatococcus asaccharovorans TaxID=28210 RepID=A0A2V3U764_9HYPH|nr:hypothetical protein C7450_105425 [Chelatococcus asaccharovorans]
MGVSSRSAKELFLIENNSRYENKNLKTVTAPGPPSNRSAIRDVAAPQQSDLALGQLPRPASSVRKR